MSPAPSFLSLALAVGLVAAACAAPGPPRAALSQAPPDPNGSASVAAGTSGRLVAVGSMLVPRANHSATLLADGRVLIAGGCTLDSCEGVTARTELFDPVAGRSVEGPEMTEPRVGHRALALGDGRILLVGGWGPGAVTRTTELYDAASNTFVRGPDLAGPRADATVVPLPDGTVLIAGGFDGRASLATAEIYDPLANAFRATGTMTETRGSQSGAPLPDGRVLVTGGSYGGTGAGVRSSAEIYDPVTGSWAATGAMAIRRHKHAAIALADGRVLVLGGSDERDGRGGIPSAEIFDPDRGRFTPTAAMSAARYKIGDAVARLGDGRVLVAGGGPTAELFDPTRHSFTPVGGDQQEGFSFAVAVPLADGSILVAGGYDRTIALTAEVLRFAP